MFPMRLPPNTLIPQHPRHSRKQLLLLIIMMALHKPVPRQRVTQKRRFIRIQHVRRLQVDRVEAAQNSVVDVRHVCCAGGENVGLRINVSDFCLFVRVGVMCVGLDDREFGSVLLFSWHIAAS